MHTAEQFTHRGLKVHIYYDPDPLNPRKEFDHVGTMACWHRRYNLGDEQPSVAPTEFADELPKGTVILPLYFYDHSGITISTAPFSCPWDSGQVGYIYATPATIRKEYSVTEITPEIRAQVAAGLRSEVDEYDQYLRGDVYGYVVEGEDGEQLDSCWGFYGGRGYCKGEATHAADYHADQRDAQIELEALEHD